MVQCRRRSDGIPVTRIRITAIKPASQLPCPIQAAFNDDMVLVTVQRMHNVCGYTHIQVPALYFEAMAPGTAFVKVFLIASANDEPINLFDRPSSLSSAGRSFISL